MSGRRPAKSTPASPRTPQAARRRPLTPRASGNRARQAARAASARRRRIGWLITLALIVAVSGTILGLHLAAGPSSSPGSTTAPVAAAGQPAPDGAFTTVSGQQVRISSLRGQPVLLWFVATWCPSCQTGAQSVAQNLSRFKAAGVTVVTLELYQDLGQSGPGIDTFGRTLAGPAYNTPTWQFGTATAELTRSYDPNAYLDIYYLLDRTGTITYINSSPGATMNDLLAHASTLR